jgi:hypothetical protein
MCVVRLVTALSRWLKPLGVVVCLSLRRGRVVLALKALNGVPASCLSRIRLAQRNSTHSYLKRLSLIPTPHKQASNVYQTVDTVGDGWLIM